MRTKTLPAEKVSAPPVLITEQEVMLGTAIAAAISTASTANGHGGWLAKLTGLLRPSREHSRRECRPPRLEPEYLSNARMYRAMERL